MSEEKDYYEEGDAFTISAHNSVDRAEAAAAADQSVLDQQRQLDAFSKMFGTRSVSPDRPSRPIFLDKLGKDKLGKDKLGKDKLGKGALRSHPYQPKPFRPEFFYLDDGSEYLKAAMQCDPGHVPNYDNNVPFLMYTHKPSSACSKNGNNKYLSWDSDKGKYCCQATPDTSEKIMEKSLQNIEHMVSGVAINRRSFDRLDKALTKYFIHFSLLNRGNPDLIVKKQLEMYNLIQKYKTDLTTDKEARSKRRERATPLTVTEANKLWGSTHGALSASSAAEPNADDLLKKGGGRSRVKRNRSKRNRSKRNRSKRNRSKRNSRRNKNNK
jgi:hypothetical protein